MGGSAKQQKLIGSVLVYGVLIILCVIWTLPTLGTLVTSFRHRDDTKRTGWWTAFSDPNFTMSNYQQAVAGKEVEIVDSSGNRVTVAGKDMSQAFINSLTVTIPSVVIPLLIAAFAAYGFAWLNFPGRKFFFTFVVALMVVPLQIALVPILRDYKTLDLNGTWLAIWLAHTGFGLTLSIYLLFNYISTLPRDILESAFMDGASQFTIFTRLILPLSIPAIASLTILQFLWVWNDFLVATVFLGTKNEVMVLTQYLQGLVGERASDWHLLTAGAFVTMIVPLIVFFALQRFFVRGMLAGSVKG
ncbi:MAG TPA: carbohydrate ABC transporter permease [Chloroflexi bacterium]|nr:carbohydrate ABC transporter permease [Chloroflexota bacterium]